LEQFPLQLEDIVELELESSAAGILACGGAMGKLMRSLDWSQTPLGMPKTWPESFRSALSICLNAQFPIALYWGETLALVYNDAWRPIVGNKHPWSMGRAGFEVWPEIWEVIEPLFTKVRETGEGTFSSDQLLVMHRHGYAEECYFDFTFSPIKNPNGTVGGIFNAVQETTYRVINDRRSRLLREIASMMAAAKGTDLACSYAAQAIATNPQDIPFALLYLVDTENRRLVYSERQASRKMLLPVARSASTSRAKGWTNGIFQKWFKPAWLSIFN
jgi:hypothetical protein